MTALPAPIARLLDFLGALGPRWGLPEAPCRVHGYLYLRARAVPEAEIAAAVALDTAAVREALGWLTDYRLVERTQAGWRTESDPWELMLRALDERRRREAGPALDILRECHATPPHARIARWSRRSPDRSASC
jgi:DNA-binding transcriptional regulator GbsR (MarR family)